MDQIQVLMVKNDDFGVCREADRGLFEDLGFPEICERLRYRIYWIPWSRERLWYFNLWIPQSLSGFAHLGCFEGFWYPGARG